MSQTMIDSARLQFSGLSAEDFEDVPEIGEQRTYTIIATCQSHTERAMANEGTRKSVNMKVVRVLSGVDKSIEEKDDDEPSLFDQPAPEDSSEPEDDRDSDAELADGQHDDEAPAGGLSVFSGGPQFSAGGDE
ncbi:hypothetical protein GS917_25210 [Rhodococcus hoagii]|uniref:DUF7171 family protein n=1 Tax=Rhodococcus hoagii TaxID=43767 RepID=UPI000A11F3B0|nr:hypothetical protein [Prescottella equi]NKT99796.1 hypothetical protein [Prescottella equi]NKU00936.1 hypothetical protein [Prescottella equi]NKU01739.1 hypothetical protein [Prescottella equi]NKV36721.1 hypothetical protein [Prescottella equi]NKV37949.1 hypothetical protein [Prescottella equi]